MSVVGAAFSKYGVIMMGDTKATSLSSSHEDELVEKVIKSNNKMLGLTGDVNDLIKFLYPIITPNLKFSDYKIQHGMFLPLLDSMFYEAISENRHYNIQFMAAERIRSYYIFNTYSLFDYELHSYSPKSLSIELLGMKKHKSNFKNEMKNRESNEFECIVSCFQNVLNIGSEFDKSINNVIHYEYFGDLRFYEK